MGDLEGAGAAGPGGLTEFRVDCHIHTRASVDCLNEPADVIATARSRGLDRIAITDHNEIDGAFRCRDLDPERVIVGEEVKTAEGIDITGLYLASKIPKGLSAVDTAAAIHEQGGLVYVPHPFAGGKGAGAHVLDEIADHVDIIEVFNARIHRPERNRRAVDWARLRGLPGAAGSDAHTLREIGRGMTIVPAFHGKADLLESLRSGRVVGRPSGRWVHIASTGARLARRLGLAGRGIDSGA